ncbi:MAG TPA: heme-copper oxidase subunit III [Candidatus Saccharimonadales bacterium]|nr:heme-copper oxidase subunit III [Candidatus Saccharimonadales bacterium]
MGTASEASHEVEIPEYYEHSFWPVLIAAATGVAMTGIFLLLKGLVLYAGILMALSFVGIVVIFLYSDTKNWSASLSKFGRIPRDTVLGGFPVDISLTIQIIIMTELLLFGGAFAMYFAIRIRMGIWPPLGTPTLDDTIAKIQTLILISSSILVELAVYKLKQGNQRAFRAGLIGTTILGAMFPILQFGFEWPHLLLNNILTPSTNFFGATFFLLTGIHGVHVVAGVLAFSYTDVRAFMGQYSPKNHGFVEATSTYWHFVHIIWLFLFALMWQGSRLLI